MTNNQLTSTHLAVKSELDGYKIHASRGQATAMAMVRLFESIDRDLEELQERRQATMNSEPVAYTDERNLGYIDRGRETAYLWGKQNSETGDVPLYRHAQLAPASPICTCPSGDGSLRWPCPVHAGGSPVIPDGYVMVPKEPTEAMMLHNSGCQHHAWDDPDCAMRQTRRLIWSHMLAAASQEPKP